MIFNKQCTKCVLEKVLEDFGKDSRHKDGLQSQCRTCCSQQKRIRFTTLEGKAIRKQQNAIYHQIHAHEISSRRAKKYRKNQEFINQYKIKQCTDCGQQYPSECMELDHIFGNKFDNVSAMKFRSLDKIIQEINKCEIVCAVCHRIRTEKRRSPSKDKRLLAHRTQINEFKNRPCTDCQLSFPSVAMDLDHIRGEKIMEISNMGHYPRQKVTEELDKCDVVCACCHRIRTKIRLQEPK